MTPDEKARDEADRTYANYSEPARSFLASGFQSGAAWQRSQPVEVTEEMVEAAAWSLYVFECRRQGIEPVKQQHEPGWSKIAWSKVAHTALSAALPFLRPEPTEDDEMKALIARIQMNADFYGRDSDVVRLANALDASYDAGRRELAARFATQDATRRAAIEELIAWEDEHAAAHPDEETV